MCTSQHNSCHVFSQVLQIQLQMVQQGVAASATDNVSAEHAGN
jgi:hypothetical protein